MDILKRLTISKHDIKRTPIVHLGEHINDWYIGAISEDHCEQILELARIGLDYVEKVVSKVGKAKPEGER